MSNGNAPQNKKNSRIARLIQSMKKHKIRSLFIVIPLLFAGYAVACVVTALSPAPRGSVEPSDTPSQIQVTEDPTPSASPSTSSAPAPAISLPTDSHKVCFDLNVGYSEVSGEVSGVDKASTKLYLNDIQAGPEKHAGSIGSTRSSDMEQMRVQAFTDRHQEVAVAMSSLDNNYNGELKLCANVGKNEIYDVTGSALFSGDEPTNLSAYLFGPSKDTPLDKAGKDAVQNGANLRYDFTDAQPLTESVVLLVEDGQKAVASVELVLGALN